MLPHHAGLVFQAVTHSLSRRAIYGVHSVYQGSAHSALALDLDSNSVSFASHLEQCLADPPASNQNRVFFRDGAIHTEQTKFARLSVALCGVHQRVARPKPRSLAANRNQCCDMGLWAGPWRPHVWHMHHHEHWQERKLPACVDKHALNLRSSLATRNPCPSLDLYFR